MLMCLLMVVAVDGSGRGSDGTASFNGSVTVTGVGNGKLLLAYDGKWLLMVVAVDGKHAEAAITRRLMVQ